MPPMPLIIMPPPIWCCCCCCCCCIIIICCCCCCCCMPIAILFVIMPPLIIMPPPIIPPPIIPPPIMPPAIPPAMPPAIPPPPPRLIAPIALLVEATAAAATGTAAGGDDMKPKPLTPLGFAGAVEAFADGPKRSPMRSSTGAVAAAFATVCAKTGAVCARTSGGRGGTAVDATVTDDAAACGASPNGSQSSFIAGAETERWIGAAATAAGAADARGVRDLRSRLFFFFFRDDEDESPPSSFGAGAARPASSRNCLRLKTISTKRLCPSRECCGSTRSISVHFPSHFARALSLPPPCRWCIALTSAGFQVDIVMDCRGKEAREREREREKRNGRRGRWCA